MSDPAIKPARGKWSRIRKELDGWSRPALIALLHDLYQASAANRDFVNARFQAEENDGAAIEPYRKRIVDQFFPARGFGKLRLSDARKAIRDYKKATGNIAGTLDLLLTYVENGTEFTQQFGDINASFYSSLASALNELVILFLNGGEEYYPHFRERLQRLDARADGIGWGFGDELRDQIARLQSELDTER